MATIEVTYEEFRKLGAELLKALDVSDYDQIENGLHCLGCAYLGLGIKQPLSRAEQEVLAPSFLEYVTSKALMRQAELLYAEGA
jgi:hypothetical protein